MTGGGSKGRWPSIRLGFLFREIDERVGADVGDVSLLSVSIHRGVLPRTEMTDREPRADGFATYKRVAVGDIVINRMRAFEGGAGISLFDGMVSSDYAVLRPGARLDARYFHHLIRSRWFVGEMIARLRGIGNVEAGNVRTPRINVDDLGDIRVGLPDRREQRAIAAYLDAETEHIDALANAKQRQVTLIWEHFAAITAQTVGGGAYPRVAVRRIFRVVNGSTPPSGVASFWDGDIVWITPQDLSRANQVMTGSARTITEDGYAVCGTSMVPAGSILLSTRAPIGSVAIAGTELCTNQGCKALVSAKPVDPWFFYFVFAAAAQELESLGNGSTFRELGSEDLGALKVPVPPLAVQRELASRLRRAQLSSQRLATTVSRQIELLLERRQALVTAAVTGQLEIPGVAA